MEDGLQRGASKMALIIPPKFAQNLARGEPAPVQVLVDGTYSATAFGVMRLVGVSVALILGLVLVILWLMDRFVWKKGETS